MNNHRYEIGPSNSGTGELFTIQSPVDNKVMKERRITLGPVQLEVLTNAALHEDVLRSYGMRPEKIKEKVQLWRQMAHLVARGYDIAGMVPPERPIVAEHDGKPEYADPRMAAAHDPKEAK
jgi:hypothetical protein